MAYTTTQARYETSLAAAHRALYKAMSYACDLGFLGEADDLYQLLQHVSTLSEESLGRKRRTRTEISGQQRLC